jgi:hypothetical protein
MDKICIPAVDNKEAQNIEDGQSYLEIFDDYLEISHEGLLREEDDKLGMPAERFYDEIVIIRKSFIGGLELHYEENTEIYWLRLLTHTDVVSIPVPTKQYGIDLLNIIRDWAFSE